MLIQYGRKAVLVWRPALCFGWQNSLISGKIYVLPIKF